MQDTRSNNHQPLIIYVPGLLPKPQAAEHRDALFRCLVEGVRRADEDIAARLRSADHSFEVVAWTFGFYNEHREFERDEAAVDAVLEQASASDEDMREAAGWARRATLWVYRLGDRLPFLIPHLATEKMEVHLKDLHRYLQNEDGVADQVRDMLKQVLRAGAEMQRPMLLIGHSMGSVIAWDTLWELTWKNREEFDVDLFLSMGSPLGQRYVQKRLKGHDRSGHERFPANINRWVNLAAAGDMTAIDPKLAGDFAEMRRLGFVESITDLPVFNYFRLDGQLNVHAEYGYLVNAVTGGVIADFWRSAT